MTERQKYEVIGMIGSVEIRRYLPYVAADVVVKGDYESAGNSGFRPLANYIFSNNIAMTAPVLVEEKDKDAWQVSFVMPAGSKLSEMPEPAQNIKLRAGHEEVCAVVRFNGSTSANKIAKTETQLRDILTENKIAITGKPRVARFDPPWKPGILRHNELIMPIEWSH